MSKWIVKRGNTAVQDIEVTDEDGELVDNLAAATSIVFQVKDKKTSTYHKIEKTKGDGIAVNTPSLGHLELSLTPTDTDMLIKKYKMAMEITWSPTDKYEIDLEIDDELTDVFEIVQDIIL